MIKWVGGWIGYQSMDNRTVHWDIEMATVHSVPRGTCRLVRDQLYHKLDDGG